MCCNRDIIIEPIVVHNRGASLQQTNCMKIHPHNLIRRSNLFVARKLLRHEPMTGWWWYPRFQPMIVCNNKWWYPPYFSPCFYATTNFSKNQDVLITGMLLFKPYHELRASMHEMAWRINMCLYLPGYHGTHPTWLRAVMQQIWTWFVALQLLLAPNHDWEIWWSEKKKTARKYFLSAEKWRVLFCSTLII